MMMNGTDSTQNTEKRPSSFGEKTFDLTTYAGIGGIGSFVATIPTADWIKDGGGKKHYDAAIKGLEKNLKHVTGPKTAHNIAKTALISFATMWGGNLVVAPIWAAEKIRTPIINNLNKFVGDTTPPETIKDKPEQTASSLLKGRAAAYVAVFLGFTGLELLVGGSKMEKFQNAFGRAGSAFMNKPTHKMKLDAGKLKKVETKSFRYGKMLALDVIATVTAVSLLYSTSRFFAKKQQPPEIDEASAATEQTEPSAIDPIETAEKTESMVEESIKTPNAVIEAATHEGVAVTHEALGVA